MRLKPSLYLMGGLALAIAAPLMVLAVFIQPIAGEAPLEAGKLFAWKLSVLALYASAALIIAALLVLALRYAATDQAGWALLALAAVIPGTVGYLAGTATAWSYLATGVVAGVAPIPPPAWGVAAMAAAGRMVCWGGLAAEGIAIRRDAAFPRWYGPVGIVIGGLEIIGEIALGYDLPLMLLWLLGFVWLFGLGLLMLQARSRLAAAEPTPELTSTGV